MKRILIIVALLAGCNESETYSAPVENDRITQLPELAAPLPELEIQPIEPAEPIIPAVPIEPSEPIKPEVPPMPIFLADGIQTHTQQPYSGVVSRDGNVYLYEQDHVKLMRDFELPKYKVEYKYKPYLEILIGDECIRYDFDTQLFGMAQAHCVFSNPKDGVSLEDIKSAYFGSEIDAIRVWVNGVAGLSVNARL